MGFAGQIFAARVAVGLAVPSPKAMQAQGGLLAKGIESMYKRTNSVALNAINLTCRFISKIYTICKFSFCIVHLLIFMHRFHDDLGREHSSLVHHLELHRTHHRCSVILEKQISDDRKQHKYRREIKCQKTKKRTAFIGC